MTLLIASCVFGIGIAGLLINYQVESLRHRIERLERHAHEHPVATSRSVTAEEHHA